MIRLNKFRALVKHRGQTFRFRGGLNRECIFRIRQCPVFKCGELQRQDVRLADLMELI